MTTPQRPLVDEGNPLLSQGPAQLDTGTVNTPDGKLGLLTIRTGSTTLTVILPPANVREWANVLNNFAASMGGLVTASAADVAAVAVRAAGTAPR